MRRRRKSTRSRATVARPPLVCSLLATFSLGALGCTTATHYVSAKPLPDGASEFALSVDMNRVVDRASGTDARGVGFYSPYYSSTDLSPRTSSFAERKDVSTVIIGLPTFAFRKGVGNDVQVGGFVGGRGLGADVVIGIVRGPTSVAWLAAPSLGIRAARVDLPLLVSRTFGDRVELIGSVGPLFGLALGEVADATSGVLARLGAGLRVRINTWLFVHPESVFATSIPGTRDHLDTWLSAGIGFGGTYP